MPKTYQVNSQVRWVNRVVGGLLKLGVRLPHTYLLTVAGRKTGKLYTTPVTLVEDETGRWLVAPYGEVSWLRNARAAGQIRLTQGRHTETLSFAPVGPGGSAPILKKYVAQAPTTQPYFDARPDSPLAAFEAEAASHPVFRLSAAPAA